MLTKGILNENYGTKQEIINSFGMHEGELSRVSFLEKLIKEDHVLGFIHLPKQHKLLFEIVNGFGVRYILDGDDFDDSVPFKEGLTMILNG